MHPFVKGCSNRRSGYHGAVGIFHSTIAAMNKGILLVWIIAKGFLYVWKYCNGRIGYIFPQSIPFLSIVIKIILVTCTRSRAHIFPYITRWLTIIDHIDGGSTRHLL